MVGQTIVQPYRRRRFQRLPAKARTLSLERAIRSKKRSAGGGMAMSEAAAAASSLGGSVGTPSPVHILALESVETNEGAAQTSGTAADDKESDDGAREKVLKRRASSPSSSLEAVLRLQTSPAHSTTLLSHNLQSDVKLNGSYKNVSDIDRNEQRDTSSSNVSLSINSQSENGSNSAESYKLPLKYQKTSLTSKVTNISRLAANTNVSTLPVSSSTTSNIVDVPSPDRCLLNLDYQNTSSQSYYNHSKSNNIEAVQGNNKQNNSNTNQDLQDDQRHRVRHQPRQQQSCQQQSQHHQNHQQNQNNIQQQNYGHNVQQVHNSLTYNLLDHQQQVYQHHLQQFHHPTIDQSHYNEFFVSSPQQYSGQYPNQYHNHSYQPVDYHHRFNLPLPQQANLCRSPPAMNANSFFTNLANNISLPTSPTSETGQHSPLTPPSISQNEQVPVTRNVDGKVSNSLSNLRVPNHIGQFPNIPNFPGVNQVNGTNGTYPATPDRLTPISPQTGPNTSPIPPVNPSALTQSDRRDKAKATPLLSQVNLESIIPPIGVMHHMGGQTGLPEMNGNSTMVTNNQGPHTGGPNQPGLSQQYCDEEELPSCAFAHPRLHGLPFLVHRKYIIRRK